MIHHIYQHRFLILFFLTFFAAIVVSIWAVIVWRQAKDYFNQFKKYL